jgi:hypothetical protein
MTSRNTPRRRGSARRSSAPRAAASSRGLGSVETSGLGTSRPARLVEREAPYLIDELKRVAIVTATCIGLLAVLTVVDRMR